MKIEQQVTSLELSQKLEKLGVKQESVWYYDLLMNVSIPPLVLFGNYVIDHRDSYLSAFTVAELGELLPREFDYKVSENGSRSVNFSSGKTIMDKGWYVLYSDPHPANKVPYYARHAVTEANARAKMLIYLLENKLLKT